MPRKKQIQNEHVSSGNATVEESPAERRKRYQREYYQNHKEEAKAYQRQYNLTHKKKSRARQGQSGTHACREIVQTTFHQSHIMQAPTEKALKLLEQIISGEREFIR